MPKQPEQHVGMSMQLRRTNHVTIAKHQARRSVQPVCPKVAEEVEQVVSVRKIKQQASLPRPDVNARYIPTPEDIAVACRQIQANWSDLERRRATYGLPTPVETRMIAGGKYCNRILIDG